jgi:hypothetical protein
MVHSAIQQELQGTKGTDRLSGASLQTVQRYLFEREPAPFAPQ